MSEIRTQPVRAQHIADWDSFDDQLLAGSFSASPAEAGGPQDFWYCCPCGCGITACLVVGNGFKPATAPSWNWNGSTEAPTLAPSVHHPGHWHGWLRNGIWESC